MDDLIQQHMITVWNQRLHFKRWFIHRLQIGFTVGLINRLGLWAATLQQARRKLAKTLFCAQKCRLSWRERSCSSSCAWCFLSFFYSQKLYKENCCGASNWSRCQNEVGSSSFLFWLSYHKFKIKSLAHYVVISAHFWLHSCQSPQFLSSLFSRHLLRSKHVFLLAICVTVGLLTFYQ